MPLDSNICQSCEAQVYQESDCCMFIQNLPLCLKCFYKNSFMVQDNAIIEDLPSSIFLCRYHKLSADIYCQTCQMPICYKCLLIHRSHETEDISELQPRSLEKVKLYLLACESLQNTLKQLEKHLKIHEKYSSLDQDVSSYQETLISHYFSPYSSDIQKEATSELEKIRKNFTQKMSEETIKTFRQLKDLKTLTSEEIPQAAEQVRSQLYMKSTWSELRIPLFFLRSLTTE